MQIQLWPFSLNIREVFRFQSVNWGGSGGGYNEGPNRNNVFGVDRIDVAENTVQPRAHVSSRGHLMNLRVSHIHVGEFLDLLNDY
jgi:hypothetical protein